MKKTLTPAVRRALAYVHATGYLPAGIHTSTFFEACGPCYFEGPGRRRVNSEVMDEVRTDPLAQSVEYLIGQGFAVDPTAINPRGTSRYVPFVHTHKDRLTALAYRSGGGKICYKRDSVPYVLSYHYSKGETTGLYAVIDWFRAECERRGIAFEGDAL